MRIAINCRSILARKLTGIGRYTHDLIDYLKKIDHVNQYYLYAPLKLITLKRRMPPIGGGNFLIKPDHFKAGPEALIGGLDVYHAPSLEFFEVQKCKVVVTIHDIIYRAFSQGHTPDTIATCDRQFKNIVEKADKIICASEHTRADLHRFFSLPKERSCVVYQGVNDEIFYPMPKKDEKAADRFLKRKGIAGPYILFVGTIEPRKNLAGLLKAFALLCRRNKFSGQLVIVGMKGWMTEDIKQLIDKLNIRSSVVFMGFVSDDELRILYSRTRVFAFPSFYEGFGFPLVEAMRCGAPVVTSNVSACGEVAGKAALVIDPKSPDDIAQAIAKILDDDSLRSNLIQKGLKRSEEFSFLKTAQQTLKVYRQVSGL